MASAKRLTMLLNERDNYDRRDLAERPKLKPTTSVHRWRKFGDVADAAATRELAALSASDITPNQRAAFEARIAARMPVPRGKPWPLTWNYQTLEFEGTVPDP